jgi:hypothetical protein
METSTVETEWETIGDVCVDSATIIIADPCLVEEVMEGYSETLGYPDDNWDHTQLTIAGAGQAEGRRINAGIACRTGWGDGFYPVEIRREDGDVAELRIRFLPHPALR